MSFLTSSNITSQIKIISFIGLGLFSFLLIVTILLHIWWTKRIKLRFDQVGGEGFFFFLKRNIFAFLASIWACGLFSAFMALFKIYT